MRRRPSCSSLASAVDLPATLPGRNRASSFACTVIRGPREAAPAEWYLPRRGRGGRSPPPTSIQGFLAAVLDAAIVASVLTHPCGRTGFRFAHDVLRDRLRREVPSGSQAGYTSCRAAEHLAIIDASGP